MENDPEHKRSHEETCPQRIRAANLTGLVLALTLTHDEITGTKKKLENFFSSFKWRRIIFE